jgi:hypothetical protein
MKKSLDYGMNELWSTPVYRGQVEDTNLLERLLQSTFLNVDLDKPAGDFQSYDVLSDGPKEFVEFREQVVYPAFSDYMKNIGFNIDEFSDARIRSWITGVRNGYMIPIHNHSGASFSAVFYLLCESMNEGGELVMMDPRTNANRGYKDQFKTMFANETYLPRSGEFIIFPSYLYHHTIAYTGNMRIALPVDLFL